MAYNPNTDRKAMFPYYVYPKRWKTEIIDNGIRITGADSLIILLKRLGLNRIYICTCTAYSR